MMSGGDHQKELIAAILKYLDAGGTGEQAKLFLSAVIRIREIQQGAKKSKGNA